MKKVMLVCLLALWVKGGVLAQATEIVQLGLNIEKLAQLKSILKNLKSGYDIVSKGYRSIKDISEGNFSLHQVFLDGLMEVSPAVKKYQKVPAIIGYQLALIKEYKRAYSWFQGSGWFNVQELQYLSRVYDNLFKSSLKNLDELTNIVTAGKLRMSDDERLQSIDRLHAEMEDKVLFLRHFNSEASVLALQRAREQNDVDGIRLMYDLK